ncbi:ABC transporter ATP-binding protein [Rhizobium sp. Nf11,1]|uniref:ABC transporter ATP-binding protein n=1 Tax=Rhizobium sp. Nf11,1 TaxID=3404923 RepID=UPI003D34EEAD
MLDRDFLKLLLRLWGHISVHRKQQLFILLILNFFSAFVEILSIGTVLPFLGALTSPDAMLQNRFLQPAIKAFGITDGHQLALFLTVVFASTALAAGLFRLGFLWYQTRLSHAIGADLSIDIYRRTLYQPYTVHVARNSSEVIAGISSKANGVTNGIILPSLTMVSSVFTLVAIVATIAYIQPTIAIVSLVFLGGAYAGVTMVVKEELGRNSQHINEGSNKVIKALQEGLGGIRDVLIDGAQAQYCEVYRLADHKVRRATAYVQIISSAPRYMIEALGMVLIALISYFFVSSGEGIEKTIPILGALALGAQRLLPISQQIYSSLAFFKAGRSPLVDVLSLLDQPLPSYLALPPAEPLAFEKAIALRNVVFSYGPDLPPVLKGLDLEIPMGARVGFIGMTGSGKSTLLDIVMGLLPTDGSLTIDGTRIDENNVRRWQSLIAHVPQSIFLSDATVAENIAFGLKREDIDMPRVKQAAEAAQLSATIAAMGKGYDTFVGERGIRLSGGQRQRIGIARALYKNAKVVVLDEATSALDNDTESAVMETLNGLRDRLTILMVAHRLSTLSNCDFIVELVDGVVSRVGTYEELIGSRSNPDR